MINENAVWGRMVRFLSLPTPFAQSGTTTAILPLQPFPMASPTRNLSVEIIQQESDTDTEEIEDEDDELDEYAAHAHHTHARFPILPRFPVPTQRKSMNLHCCAPRRTARSLACKRPHSYAFAHIALYMHMRFTH